MNWPTKTLAEVCLPISKVNPVETGRERVQYVDIGVVDGVHHTIDGVGWVESAAAPSRCRQVLRSGDTVFSTVRPYLEKIAFIRDRLDGEFASTGFCVLRPNEEVEPRFLFHYSTSRGLLDQVLPKQKGVSYPAVLDREVRACQLPVPPLMEQRRIVAILEEHLSDLDDAAASLRVAEDKLRALAPSWLSHKLSSLDGELREIGSVLTEARGGWSRSIRHLVQASQGVPYLKMNNITSDGALSLTDLVFVSPQPDSDAKYGVRRGDLLFNSKNSAELVGKTALADQRVERALLNENIMRLRFNSVLDPAFVWAWFQGPVMKRKIADATRASTNVAAIYQHRLVEMPILVPSMQQQLRVAAEFTALGDSSAMTRASIKAALRRAESLRRAVLAAAFSGCLTGHASDTGVIEELAEEESA